MDGKFKMWERAYGRDLLYTQLTERFGSFDTWGNKNYPENRRDEFNIFTEDYAKVMTFFSGGKTTALGVRMQIKYITHPVESSTVRGYYRTLIMNQAAAIKAGFLVVEEELDPEEC